MHAGRRVCRVRGIGGQPVDAGQVKGTRTSISHSLHYSMSTLLVFNMAGWTGAAPRPSRRPVGSRGPAASVTRVDLRNSDQRTNRCAARHLSCHVEYIKHRLAPALGSVQRSIPYLEANTDAARAGAGLIYDVVAQRRPQHVRTAPRQRQDRLCVTSSFAAFAVVVGLGLWTGSDAGLRRQAEHSQQAAMTIRPLV